MADFTNWNTDLQNAPFHEDLICLLKNGKVRILKNTGETPTRGPQTAWCSIVDGRRYTSPVIAYAIILNRVLLPDQDQSHSQPNERHKTTRPNWLPRNPIGP